jgi:hypothetical protein
MIMTAAMVCIKSNFPVYCAECGNRSGRPNGMRNTVTKGVVQQVRCLECRHQWALPSGNEDVLFSGQRIHLKTELLVKAFALMVMRVPMSSVEKLLMIKAETVRNKLESLLKEEGWEVLDAVLKERFRIPEFDRSEFCRAIVVGREFDQSAYRCWGKEFGRLEGADRAKSMRLIARILGRSVKRGMLTQRHGDRKARSCSTR